MVNLMQIDMLQLSVLTTQMDNVCLQTTLLMGIAVLMWSGEILHQFVEDDNEVCIWKQTVSLFFGHIFFYCIASCISFGVLILISMLYIKVGAQRAALTVSTGASVAITHAHCTNAPPPKP